MISLNEAKARVLHKLARKRIWGAKHTAFDNLSRGFHPKLANEIKNASKELITQGFLIKKPTSYGLHISLNPKMKKEIIELIEEYFKSESSF